MARMTLSAQGWITSFARELGILEPSPEEIETLLALAGVAAYSSERTAAPISCWIAASAAVAPSRALDIAESLAARLETDRTSDSS